MRLCASERGCFYFKVCGAFNRDTERVSMYGVRVSLFLDELWKSDGRGFLGVVFGTCNSGGFRVNLSSIQN